MSYGLPFVITVTCFSSGEARQGRHNAAALRRTSRPPTTTHIIPSPPPQVRRGISSPDSLLFAGQDVRGWLALSVVCAMGT